MKFPIKVIPIVLVLSGCASGPTYNNPPKVIDYSDLNQYWVEKDPVTEKNTKIISSPKMGCKTVYLPESGQISDDSISVKFTIDSTGKQYDQEITSTSKNVDLELAKWSLTFGLSPSYSFVPAQNNTSRIPIISNKILYLVSGSSLCSNKPEDVAFYSNQKITITNRDLSK